jgi:hypothetical protein
VRRRTHAFEEIVSRRDAAHRFEILSRGDFLVDRVESLEAICQKTLLKVRPKILISGLAIKSFAGSLLRAVPDRRSCSTVLATPFTMNGVSSGLTSMLVTPSVTSTASGFPGQTNGELHDPDANLHDGQSQSFCDAA